jgi:N-acetylmuramoyl-L-alanine amidase
MEITQNFLSLGKIARGDANSNRPLLFTRQLEKIIIHWIGPFPHHTLAGVRNWWENGSDGRGVRASAHFIVKDKDVLQCLPLNEIGWHSGDTRNHNSIGIEVIPANAAGEFSETTIDTLKQLVQHIRKETGMNLELERHFDGVQKKDCPRFYTSVISLLDGGGRVANPPGGQERWEVLKQSLTQG